MNSTHAFLKLSLLILAIAVLFHCARKNIPYDYDQSIVLDNIPGQEAEVEKPDEEPLDRIIAAVNRDSVSMYLKKYVNDIRTDQQFRISGRLIFSQNVLPGLYEKNHYKLIWSDIINRRQAVQALSDSWRDGLVAEDYHIEEIMEIASNLLNEELVDHSSIAALDILLTDGILLYAYHLIKGKVDPKSVDINWNMNSREIPMNPDRLFSVAIENQTICSTILDFKPKLPLYKALEDGLEKYYNIKKGGGWANLEISTVIKPGETNVAITQLRRRLLMEGYEVKGLESAEYDGQLVTTMKRFQENHGLNPDGIIGKNTLVALNRTVEQKIDQLRVNLERARWVLDNNEGKLLVVNIAKYRLYIFESDHRTYETNVMVGTQYTQTPVFMAPMRYIEFNPTWTVPFSISTKEILPKLKADKDYLSTRNMVVLDQGGTEMDQTKIDWTKYSAGNFPFVIRQGPGPQNALGRVKFMFPNEHAVYLHDTPSRYLFSKDSRAFSHGCVRVEDPLKLAEVILNEPDKWNEESIQKVIDTNKTTRVNLKEPIPVLLMYWTAGLGSNGELFFVDDIYNRDERLLKAINNHNWDEMVINARKSLSVQY